MTNRAWYLTLEGVKRETKIPDPLDDASIVDSIEAVTDALPREFFGQTEDRTLTACHHDHVLMGSYDLLEATQIATDDGSWTYPTIWSASDYRLLPGNALTMNPPHPYWKVQKAPQAANWFPVGIPEGVRITGRWGFCDIWQDSGVVIEMPAPVNPPGLSLTETALTVSAATIERGHTLRIGTENLFVTAVGNKTVTVERGMNGTEPAVHADAAAIQVQIYPGAVRKATMILVEKWLRRTKDAPFGVIGSIDGFMRLAINDPDVVTLLKFAEKANY